MGSVGDAYDNAMGESFISTLEHELLSRKKLASRAAAEFRHIEAFQSPIRLHSAIGYKSPIRSERADPRTRYSRLAPRPSSLHGGGATANSNPVATELGDHMNSAFSPRASKPDNGWADLHTIWDRRTRLAAEWLRSRRAIVDIGCGLMALEAYLPRSTKYVPMDVIARDSRTIVFDINKAPIPVVDCDAAVMLGVLEYVEDITGVLSQLRAFPSSVISFNHIWLNDLLWKLKLRRKRVTWRQRHTARQFRALLTSCGLEIIRQRRIRFGERLYEVRANPAQPPSARRSGVVVPTSPRVMQRGEGPR